MLIFIILLGIKWNEHIIDSILEKATNDLKRS